MTMTSRNRVTEYLLQITDQDMCAAQLTDFDLSLRAECETGTLADKLLWLETLVRRIEEARQQSMPGKKV